MTVEAVGGAERLSERQAAARAGHVPAPKFTIVQQLRGLNALLIVLPHIIHTVAPTFNSVLDDPIGIDTFFIIGGFMMFYSSRNDFGQPNARSNYYARRISRIVPLYWLCTAAFVGLRVLSPNPMPFGAGQILCSLTFIPCGFDAARNELHAVYGPGWFLDYLLFFDFVFGLFLFLPRRAGAMAISATLIAFVFLGLFHIENPVLAAWTRPTALKFVAGLGLGYLCMHRQTLGLVFKIRAPLAWFAAIFAASFLVTYFGVEAGTTSLQWRPIHGLFAVALVALAVFTLEPKTNGLIARAANALGDASYSVYLSHPLLLKATFALWLAAGLGTTVFRWSYAIAMMPIAAVCGVLVYRRIEAPMTAYLIAHWHRYRAAVSA